MIQKPMIDCMFLIYKLTVHPPCCTAYRNPDTVEDEDVRWFVMVICPPKQRMQSKSKNDDIQVCPYYLKKVETVCLFI